MDPTCSFCLKPADDVGTLVAGLGVYICDGCVTLCTELIVDKPPGPRPRIPLWELTDSVGEVLGTLPRMAAAHAQVEENLHGWVGRARSLGATWAAIGEALGTTRQSAWERFAGAE